MDPNSLNAVGRIAASSNQTQTDGASSVKPSQSRPAPLWDVLNNDTDFSVLPGSGSSSLAPSAPLSPSFATQPLSPSGFPTRSILQPRGPAKDGRKRKRSRLTADLMPFDSVDYWLEFDNNNQTSGDSAPAKPNDDFADIDFSEPEPQPAATGTDYTTAQQAPTSQRQQPMTYPVRSSNPMKVGDILDDTALENALSDEDNDFSSMNLAEQLSRIDSMPPPEIPQRDGLYSTPLSWERPQMGLRLDSLIGWPTPTLTPEEQQRLIAIAMNPGSSMGGLGYNLGGNFGLGGGLGMGGFGSTAGFGSAASWNDEAMKAPETKPLSQSAKSKDKEKVVKVKSEKEEKATREKAADHEKPKPGDRSAHNDIERKYRMNLKDRIAELRDAVPSLRTIPEEGGDDDDDEEGTSQPSRAPKASKGTVLTKATEYIQYLEKKNKAITQQHRELSRRIQAFEQLLSASAARPVFQMPTYSRTLFDPRAFC